MHAKALRRSSSVSGPRGSGHRARTAVTAGPMARPGHSVQEPFDGTTTGALILSISVGKPRTLKSDEKPCTRIRNLIRIPFASLGPSPEMQRRPHLEATRDPDALGDTRRPATYRRPRSARKWDP